MKSAHKIGLALALVAVGWLIIRAADTVTETTKTTTLKTTRSIVSITFYPTAVLSGGVPVSTNIGSVEVNYTERSVDADGHEVYVINGATVLNRDQVWAATNTAWRTGITNAWDGQLDAFPNRVITLWKHPDYILPPTP